MDYPLSGLKVLDFSRVLAGPFAGRMLSDLGADVVKVEPPEGDVTRFWGKSIADLPGYYHQQNAGKRNICADLREPAAIAVIEALVKEADIVIENYRPDVMDRLGLGYEHLKDINPRVIMLSISGFGHGGPESRRPAYAPVIHAEAGLIHRSASEAANADRGRHYQDLPLSVADTNASLHGLVGLLAAVIHRQTTGKGQHIDIAMIDATTATDDKIHYDLEASWETAPLRNEIYDLPHGPVLLSTDFRLLFKRLVELGYIEDPSASSDSFDEKVAKRREAVEAFLQSLETEAAFDAVMQAMNFAWGRVRNPVDARDQTTLRARGAIVDVDDRAGGLRPVTQSPYRFSSAKSGVRGPAPHRGEHNADVLSDWLGFDEAAVSALRDQGALLESQP